MVKSEKGYYDGLCKWLAMKKSYYTGGADIVYSSGKKKGKRRRYKETGVGGQIIDVAGVKNVGNDQFDQIETVAVEVRKKSSITKRDMQHAYGYSNLVHRCYLATNALPDRDELDYARRLGLGVIQLRGENWHQWQELVQPGYHEPNHADLLRFLDGLWIGQCSLCQCYIFKLESIEDLSGKSYVTLDRPRQLDFYLKYPNRELFGELEKGHVPRSIKMTHRYLCRNCVLFLGQNVSSKVKRIKTRQ